MSIRNRRKRPLSPTAANHCLASMATILLGLQAVIVHVSAANYICVADQAVVFSFDKLAAKWRAGTGTIEEDKYTLTTEDGRRVWEEAR
jgi:hypothetical protein